MEKFFKRYLVDLAGRICYAGVGIGTADWIDTACRHDRIGEPPTRWQRIFAGRLDVAKHHHIELTYLRYSDGDSRPLYVFFQSNLNRARGLIWGLTCYMNFSDQCEVDRAVRQHRDGASKRLLPIDDDVKLISAVDNVGRIRAAETRSPNHKSAANGQGFEKPNC